MTTHDSPLPLGLARSALIAGLLSVALLITFLVTSASVVTLYLSMTAGLIGVLLGIIALRKQQSVAASVTGLVTGALSLLAGAGIIVFALLFVGAFS